MKKKMGEKNEKISVSALQIDSDFSSTSKLTVNT